jgi:hypothetical protein
MHTVLLGSPSLGKTGALKTLLAGFLDRGYPGLVLDIAPSPYSDQLREFAVEYASSRAVPYHEAGDGTHSTDWINPLSGLGPDEATKLITSQYTSFKDEYWVAIATRLVQSLVNLCYDAHAADPLEAPYPTLYRIGELLEKDDLSIATKKLRAIVAASPLEVDETRYSTLRSPTNPDAQKIAAGLAARIIQAHSIIVGAAALRPRANIAPLDTAMAGLTYIGADVTEYSDLASLISSSLLMNLSLQMRHSTMSKAIPPKRFLVVTDVTATSIRVLEQLLTKARSGGLSVVLCNASASQWLGSANETPLQNINVTVTMAHTSASAVMLPPALLEDGRLAPDDIRHLGPSEAIVKVSSPSKKFGRINISPTSTPSISVT